MHYIWRDLIGVYCPVCVTGTIGIRFVDSDPPRIRFEHAEAPTETCTMGCSTREIAERCLR